VSRTTRVRPAGSALGFTASTAPYGVPGTGALIASHVDYDVPFAPVVKVMSSRALPAGGGPPVVPDSP
jgi:hypothetical protein